MADPTATALCECPERDPYLGCPKPEHQAEKTGIDLLLRGVRVSTIPVSLADGSDTTRPSGKWPQTTRSTDDR